MSRRGDSAVGPCGLVIREPKTTHSRREVPLHATTVAMLRKHRIAQMEDRMAAANVWFDEGLVFTTETGGKSPYSSTNYTSGSCTETPEH
jgi:hypothetical protein